jgi:truncated hemoglobin YjbI
MHDDNQALSVLVTEETVALLIENFYARVRRDPILAEVFHNAIAPGDWPEHLATMRTLLVVGYAGIRSVLR